MHADQALKTFQRTKEKEDRRRAATARRVVRMGLAMQRTVEEKASALGVDISVRIGVHTGKVMGGIIGTVRFHFDMFGNGVSGAVRMEELGTKGRVHLSDSTARLLVGSCPMEFSQEYDAMFVDQFGIATSYLVQTGTPPSFGRRGTITVRKSGNDDELADDVAARNMSNFVMRMHTASLTDGSGPGASSGHIVSSLLKRSKTMSALTEKSQIITSRFSSILRKQTKRPGSIWDDANKAIARDGRIRLGQWKKSKRVSLSIRQTFGGRASVNGSRNSVSSRGTSEMGKEVMRRHARAADEQKEFACQLADAQQFGMRLCEALCAFSAWLGVYDVLCDVHVLQLHPEPTSVLTAILATRYAGLVLPLILLRVGMGMYEPRTLKHVQVSAALFAAIPALAIAGMILCASSEVGPCDQLQMSGALSGGGGSSMSAGCDFPLCTAPSAAWATYAASNGGGGFPVGCASAGLATNASSALSASSSSPSALCLLGEIEGVAYCERSPLRYISSLLVLYAALPYTFTYASAFAPRAALIATAIGCSLVDLTAAGVSMYLLHADSARTPLLVSEWVMLTLWVVIAHLIGLCHQAARHTDIWETSALRLRQMRLLRSIKEETEHCNKLLLNILPPHLISKLGPKAATEAVVEKRRSFQEEKSAGSAPQLGLGVLVSESYVDCSFLFAKISGLSQLVNDEERHPAEVMHALQTIFDRFDALADMYGVQKVRKTANEYYLVAAGLPDPKILPTAEDRACGIAAYGFAMITIMHILNLELKRLGVLFTVQVGIHSGSAIAGVIGQKTVQYDLCGDAVNTAARMCSYSLPNHVHVSETTHQLLYHRFGAVCRGESQIKGKGRMKTFFLVNLPFDQKEILMYHRHDGTQSSANGLQLDQSQLPEAKPLPPPKDSEPADAEKPARTSALLTA